MSKRKKVKRQEIQPIASEGRYLVEDLRGVVDALSGDPTRLLTLFMGGSLAIRGTVGAGSTDATVILFNEDATPLWADLQQVVAFTVADTPEGW